MTQFPSKPDRICLKIQIFFENFPVQRRHTGTLAVEFSEFWFFCGHKIITPAPLRPPLNYCGPWLSLWRQRSMCPALRRCASTLTLVSWPFLYFYKKAPTLSTSHPLFSHFSSASNPSHSPWVFLPPCSFYTSPQALLSSRVVDPNSGMLLGVGTPQASPPGKVPTFSPFWCIWACFDACSL